MGKPSRIRIDTALLRVPQYCCEFKGCNKYFSKLSRLKYHQNTHLQQKPYKCEHPGCSSAYYRPNHLKRHVDSIHSGGQSDSKELSKDFRCLHEGCEAAFDTETSLHCHEKRKHYTHPFKCSFCVKSFGKKWQIKEHEAGHTGECPFKCDLENCNEEFKAYSQFKSHQRGHMKREAKSSTLTCPDPDCEQTFEKWSELASHKKTHVKADDTQCKICNKTFTQRNLKLHLPIHQEERTTVQCTFDGCPRFYFHQKNLTHHVKVKHEGLGFNCTQCDKKLSTKQKLLQHVEIIHNKKHSTPKAKKKKKVNLLENLTPMTDDDWHLKKTGPSRYVRLKWDTIKFPDTITADRSVNASHILAKPEQKDLRPEGGNHLVKLKQVETKKDNLKDYVEKIPCLKLIDVSSIN